MVRVLVFESPDGADQYLGWLENHVDEVIGQAHPVSGLLVPVGTLVFDHEPNPCCHSETRLLLAAWRTGARVVTLELGGQAVEAWSVPELVSELRASI
jgi:hypothetical protein